MRLRPHPKSKPPSHLGGGKSRAANPRYKLLGQALSPLPNLAVLLADARFVLKPDFDRSRRRHVIEMRLQRAWEVFL